MEGKVFHRWVRVSSKITWGYPCQSLDKGLAEDWLRTQPRGLHKESTQIDWIVLLVLLESLLRTGHGFEN
jgi:hypothetical protein